MKNFILTLFILLSVLKLQAQDYLIQFASDDANNPVETVEVENLTQGKSISLTGSESLHLKAIVTGINPMVTNEDVPLRVYPNPSSGDCTIEFGAKETGNVDLGIYDLVGREIAILQQSLAIGIHGFKVTGLRDGVYTIKVAVDNLTYVGKIISKSQSASRVGITYIGNMGKLQESTSLKSVQTERFWQYTTGDRLKFIGTSGKFSTVEVDIPTNNGNYVFHFIECTDGDGNNYPIVQIGNQIWMAENLKTTKYNDGTPIPNVIVNNIWSLTTNNQNLSASFQPLISSGAGSYTLTQLQGAGFINAAQRDEIEQALVKIGLTQLQIGTMSLLQINDKLTVDAYCWYNNDENYKNTYGALYNWYAVNNSKLAPVGWHVATDAEWTTLSNYLGGNSVSGGKLKETGTIHWTAQNSGATNETGFAALPGGQRNEQGSSSFVSRDADWWSFTENNSTEAWSRNITFLGGGTGVYSVDKRSGYSVRCILGTSSLPTVTTTSVSNITKTSASIGVNVTSDGGGTVTASGVCWSTSQNPTTANSKITGNGTGAFINIINGLNAGTVYYVRAYATNNAGTAYGEELTFTTLSQPVLTTTVATNITQTTATSGGNVSSDGGSPVIARGICWSTSQNPTTDNNKTIDGSGTGSFTSNITSLTDNTKYYVRAYAINSAGTAYGNEIYFTSGQIINSPTVITTAAISITQTTATSGGNITSDGGGAVTARGVCWSTSSNPTTANSKTTDGTGIGSFTSNITGLTANTEYYIRAYATNIAGTAYGDQKQFNTLVVQEVPSLTTTTVTNIAQTTATSGGNITFDGNSPVTARGICWSTSQNPTTSNSKTSDGTGTGSFTSNLTNLAPNTTYYVRAYATNTNGTGYGNQLTFTTINLPAVITTSISGITQTIANTGGNVTSDGGTPVTARGVCWSTTSEPLVTGSHTMDGSGTGSFISNITDLTAGTTYYVRAYATNSVGTSYGNELTFTTTNKPSVTTTAASNIAQTTATSGGNVTSDGGLTVTARGVCWSTTQNPTTANSKTSDGTGTGSFTSSITGLTSGTTYYVRAYATNSLGTTYGTQISFTTVTRPSITTSTITNITQMSATSGGNVTSDGGSPITSRGICWGTTSAPTIAGNHTSDGSETGAFDSSITGLTPGILYYVRAYAVNSAGTTYGNELTFTTLKLPIVVTTNRIIVGQTVATSGGNVTTDGGYPVTARGICWSTTLNPTTANSKTSDGTGIGSFTSSITGLTAGTTYYIRAYATNSLGTAYGDQVIYTTTVPLTDFDGNNYKTVIIGTQEWMAENLKTTYYNDGTSIPNPAPTTWEYNTDAAYCWYNNDYNLYGKLYGALYNWNAVNTGKLCPSGWHVPSKSEVTTLSNYYGGLSQSGGALKNLNEFAGLPAGRLTTKIFLQYNVSGFWWTSTSSDANHAWLYDNTSNSSYLEIVSGSDLFNGSTGLSVRCIKN